MNEETNIATIEEPDHVEVMPMEPNALEAMERAALDTQIVTAKKFPRSMAHFVQRAKAMVGIDQDTAVSCIYRRPVGKEHGKMVYAEGESIRLAEIIAASYGNIPVAGVIDSSDRNIRHVKAIGTAIDLETNYAAKAEVVEATVTRQGKPYTERMRVVAAKAAQSKAIRDAIFRVVPKSVCKSITNHARTIALGEGLTMQQRRDRAKEYIGILAVEPERVFAGLGVEGIEDLGEEELLTLTGVRTAIKDGDITIDEAFPPIEAEAEHKTGVSALKERISKKNGNGDDSPETDAEKEAEQTAKDKFGTDAEVEAGKKRRGRRKQKETPPTEDNPATKAEAEKQKEALSQAPPPKQGEPLYVCKDGHQFEVPKVGKGGVTLCPQCFTKEIEPLEN
jgi:hypothetical protein